MTLPATLRAIAERLEAAEAERQAALLELRRAMGLQPVSWDPTEPNADDFAASAIQQPVHGHAPADGAGAEGQAAGDPAKGTPAPSAPTDAPGADQAAGEAIGGESASAVARDSSPSSPPSDAGAVRDGRRPTRSEGVGSTPAPRSTITCPDCGRDFKPNGYGPHRRTHRPGRPTAAAAPLVQRNGGEWFLCDRCAERFPTRQARDKHRASHPPAPRGQPVGTRRPLTHSRVPSVPGGGTR